MVNRKIPDDSARMRCVQRIAALAVALVLAASVAIWCVACIARGSSSLLTSVAKAQPLSLASQSEGLFSRDAAQPSGRILYPYSVIPGGVRSAEELQNALANDSVAAAHYAGFDALSARVIHLDQPRALFVSYRVGNHIYWTRHKLTLPAGETLITDGANFARTRCGNRLSERALKPVLAVEPDPYALDQALQSPELLAAAMPAKPDVLPLVAPTIGAESPLLEVGPGGGFSASTPFFIQPVIPGGFAGVGTAGRPGTPPVTPPGTPGSTPPPVITPQPPPVVSTPEPRSDVLLFVGFATLFAFSRKRHPV